ncbi:hypothetical protein TNCV_1287491 [Trichonephila clavipes]|nr:hypothetical protein TNCV_1287491 [Trichonephila clavipes]
MITTFFIPELNNHDVQELSIQQDGATCHTARATIDLLKDTVLRDLSKKESNGGELSCLNLNSDEDIRLNESDCNESEESGDEVDNAPVNSDIYVIRDGAE